MFTFLLYPSLSISSSPRVCTLLLFVAPFPLVVASASVANIRSVCDRRVDFHRFAIMHGKDDGEGENADDEDDEDETKTEMDDA